MPSQLLAILMGGSLRQVVRRAPSGASVIHAEGCSVFVFFFVGAVARAVSARRLAQWLGECDGGQVPAHAASTRISQEVSPIADLSLFAAV
jgi:hypothetical protein